MSKDPENDTPGMPDPGDIAGGGTSPGTGGDTGGVGGGGGVLIPTDPPKGPPKNPQKYPVEIKVPLDLQPIKIPDIVLLDGNVHEIPWWEWHDYPTQPDSGNSGGDTSFDRRMTINSTILGAVVGPVYGKRRVGSYCMFLKDETSRFFVAYALAVGQSVAVDKVEFNGTEQILDTGINTVYKKLGTYDSSNRAAGFPSSDPSYYPGIVYVSFRIDKSLMSGFPQVTALVSGKKIHDFRSPSYPSDTTTNHANPALIAFDICTDLEMWKGLDVLSVNTDQLKEIADWCDEQVGGEARWHYHGPLDIRDSDEALNEVLGHCFTRAYVYNQKMYFVADMPPAAIGDVWSNSGTTFTDDGSSGTASAYSPGDTILIYEGGHHYVYTIDTVTDDHEFDTVETPGVSHSGVKVRKISSVYFKAENYVAGMTPSGVDIDFAQIPDVVNVRYATEDAKDWKTMRCEDPDGYAAGDPRVREATLNGCKTSGMATRWGHLERRAMAFCPFSWEMTVGQSGAILAPGDIFRFDDEYGLVGQLVRCQGKIEDIVSGRFDIRATEFDMGVYSDDVADDDAQPSDYIDPVTPVDPASVVHTFIETGDWDTPSVIDNPDDISGWTKPSSVLSVAYNSTYDETRFTLTGGPHADPYEYAYYDASSFIKQSSGGLFHFLVRAIGENHNVGTAMRIEYWAGATHATATQRDYKWITPWAGFGWWDAGVSDELYSRVAYWFPVSNAAVHEIRFVFGSLNDLTGVEPVFAVKRCRFVRWGKIGEPCRPQLTPESELYRCGLAERFEWIEGSGAETANESYQLMQGQGLFVPDKVLDSTHRGVNRFERRHISRGGTVLDIEHLAMTSGTDLCRGLYMTTTSITGHTSRFPVATQAFEGDSVPPAERYQDLYVNRMFSDVTNEIWRLKVFKLPTFAQGEQFWPGWIIPEENWSDYLMELWLDKTGGTDYRLVASCELGEPGPGGQRLLGFGYCTDVGQLRTQPGWGSSAFFANLDSFYFTSYAEVITAKYKIRIKSKYSGKRSDMVISNSSMMTENYPRPDQPVLTADPVLELYSYPRNDSEGNLTWVNDSKLLVGPWNPLAGAPKDPVGSYMFETRRESRPNIVTRAAWILTNAAAWQATFSTSLGATFPGELPLPTQHDQIRVVAIGSLFGYETFSAWYDILTMTAMASISEPLVSIAPDPVVLHEPVVILGEPQVILGDNVVIKDDPATVETHVDQPFAFVFTDDGGMVVI